jgi:ubiquinone/menaquinone biosynthesis C-methylase UbiE
MKCRHCETDLNINFVDLDSSPPSNSYLTETSMMEPEKWYPLNVLVCDQCWLVQTEDFVGVDEMFNEEYAYFSSYSTTWLAHTHKYVETMVNRFHLGASSHVIDIAANDGYMLQYVMQKGIPCYGIEPTHSTATEARKKGVEVIEEFFGVSLAENLMKQDRQADLIAANNVLAHVPNINDFVKGFSILLKENGVATFEFPHLLNLYKQTQFDTIYHEHYSYLSLLSIQSIFQSNGLNVFDIEELSTHGGSLRVYAQRSDTGKHLICPEVENILEKEKQAGINTHKFYTGFQAKVEKIKFELLTFLLDAKKQGKKVAAYGAAAKGNTMLNFSGVRHDLLQYVVDCNPAKQNKFMPGSRIPIVSEEKLKNDRPDYVVILPWNLKDEITQQLSYIREWDGKFVVTIPKLQVF